MTPIDQSHVRNRLLRAISRDAFSLLLPSMEAVDIPLRHVLVEADEETSHVYFMETGLASVVATSRSGDEIEVGHLGREGMSGSNIVLRCETTPNRTFMQVAGSAVRVPADRFSDLLADDPQTQTLFLRYVQTTQIQLAFSALANGRFTMHARLARWLLMCHDRLDGDLLPLTHEFLALMLGVRRAGVTDQIHVLEGLHAIKAYRGEIHVTDRALLENIAGESYGAPEREYARLMGI